MNKTYQRVPPRRKVDAKRVDRILDHGIQKPVTQHYGPALHSRSDHLAIQADSSGLDHRQDHLEGGTEGSSPRPQAQKLGESANGAQRKRAERINHVWSYDFVFDQTERGSRLKWLPVLDEYTRECLSLEVDRSITSIYVVETLEKLVEERGAHEFIRSDNGPEFIAHAVKEWIAERGMKTLYIEPGAPWQNPTARASTHASGMSSSTWSSSQVS